MENSVLELHGVHAFYADSQVLENVSMTLQEGHVLGMLGRNGAGKTTCISSIIGLLPPRKGAIHLYGENIAGLSPEKIARRRIGLVPQGRRIFPTLSVYENLLVAARSGLPDARFVWSAEEVFKLFPRLKERAKQAAGSLSGGEQQMLAISRALVANPKVLLMDEPSEGLAPQIVAEVGQIILRLKAQGMSIILVEQNTKLVFNVADDVVILNHGQISYTGTVEEIRSQHEFLNTQLGVF